MAIKAFKGFDKDLKCRGFQFEVGQTYQHAGKVEPCISGFHACENPLDVLVYYPLGSRFAEVEVGGVIEREGNKLACSSILVKNELSLADFIETAVGYLMVEVGPSGDYSRLAASGYGSQLAASGYNSQLAASGDGSQLAASGDGSKLAASGYNSQLAASGYNSQLAASGYGSQLAASGDDSKLAASGDYSQLAASGGASIAIACGEASSALAGERGCIVLARWVEDEQRYRVSVGYVGENIKAHTKYRLDDSGEFVEVACQ